jgi:outer membrane protein OmpA-like peptidoglycan-associated protein
VELNKLIDFLKKTPGVKVEIAGHTDNTGSAQYNMELSAKRAGAVVDYLIENGIQAERLFAKGYGEELPLADNETEEGRAMNRRTQLTIISF